MSFCNIRSVMNEFVYFIPPEPFNERKLVKDECLAWKGLVAREN